MTQLGDLVEMTFGFPFKSAEFTDSPNDVRLLRGDNVAQGRLRWDGVKRFPGDRFGEFAKYQLAAGDVVLAMDRPWIEAGLKYSVVRHADLPSLLVQRVARLRAKDGLDQGYLAVLVGSRQFMDYVIGTQTGSAVPHISGGQIGAFEIDRLPSPSEQRAIASVLGAFENKLESNWVAQRKALELAETFFAQAAAAADAASLGSVATLVLGGTPDRSRKEYWASGTIAWINSGAANQDVILEPSELITEEALRSSAAKLMPAGSTVIAITGATLGQVALLGIETSGNQSLVGVWANDERLTAWLHFAIRSSIDELVKTATGAAQQHVNKGNIAELIVPVPPNDVLEKWSAAALPLMRRAVQLGSESKKLAETRDAILPELLTGRIHIAEEVIA